MQSKRVYVMIAGLAVGVFSTMAPKAVAGDKAYFEVLEPKATMTTKADTVSRTLETTVSYPVVVESTSKSGTYLSGTYMVEGGYLMPVMLERTNTVKPHKLPFSFGVWP